MKIRVTHLHDGMWVRVEGKVARQMVFLWAGNIEEKLAHHEKCLAMWKDSIAPVEDSQMAREMIALNMCIIDIIKNGYKEEEE